MKTLLSKSLYRLGTATACLMMMFNTGCVSGGWELTRDYSNWINSKKVGLRVVLYLLTSLVFVITMFIDVFINNTVDFWKGKTSDSSTVFHKDGKSIFVQHETNPETQLKKSTIVIKENDKLLQTIVLKETANLEIELIVDGALHTKVESIDQAFPLFSSFDKDGKMIEKKNIFVGTEEIVKN